MNELYPLVFSRYSEMLYASLEGSVSECTNWFPSVIINFGGSTSQVEIFLVSDP